MGSRLTSLNYWPHSPAIPGILKQPPEQGNEAMAEIQKPTDQNRPDDSKAGKPDSLNPERSVSGADVGKAEKQRVNKFTTFGQMTTVNEGDSLDDARARQSALDNPFTIDFGNGSAETSAGKQNAADQIIAGNPFADGLNAAKKEAEKLWHPDREHPDIRMSYIADLEAFQATGLAKYGVDPFIIAATIRNEVVFKEPTDQIQDTALKLNPRLVSMIDKSGNVSFGDAQMQRKHLERLVNSDDENGRPLYPQLRHLRGQPSDVLLNRSSAALLVGAYYQEIAQRLEQQQNPIPWYPGAHALEIKEKIVSLWSQGTPESRTEALIRGFNPGDGSRHVNHVREQLELIKNGPAKLFE